MRFAFRSWAACLTVLALSVPVAAVDDDLGGLPGDDLSEELAAEAIDWRPVITHFYVRSGTPGADPAPLHFEEPKGGLAGLVNAWQALQPHVRLRGAEHWGQSYEEDELVISGWRTAEDGAGFEIHAGSVVPPPATEEEPRAGGVDSANARPIQALLAAQEFTVFVGIEVLMNVEDARTQDDILRFFTLDRFRLSIHRIDEDIEQFRRAPEKEPITNGRTAIESDFWLRVRDRVEDFAWPHRLRVGGAYAIRVQAAISGRVDDSEDFGPPREVEAEIRVVLVDQTITIDQLHFESTGETDIFKPED